MPSMKTCNIVVAIATLIVGSLIAYVSNGYGIAMSIYGPEPGDALSNCLYSAFRSCRFLY